MPKLNLRRADLMCEIEGLRARLQEAEETLNAIRSGEVDALVVNEKVYALKGAETPYRVLVEAIAEGAVTLLQDGTIAYSNSCFARIVQTPLEKIVGAPFEAFVSPVQHDRLRAALRHAHEASTRIEVELVTGLDTPVPAELSLSDVRLDRAAGIAVVVNDISERKRAEEELSRNAEGLRAMNGELESFSYTVSHDLRAPLRSLHGFSSILLQEHACELSEDARHCVEVINNSSLDMGRLIDDLLAFSRLGRQAMRIQDIAFRELVEHVVADLRGAWAGRRVEFAIGCLPRCQGDPTLLKQALVNLLGNALKYTSTREIARIEVGTTDVEEIEARRPGLTPEALADTTATVYYVRDNGVGFDMRYSSKLFGVFERLHRADEFEGTGVGLAIVRRIVLRHAGQVFAEGELDSGATFYFTIGNPPQAGSGIRPSSAQWSETATAKEAS
jgi:PAS domain S-box-containing protein